MKFVYIALILALVIGGYFAVTAYMDEQARMNADVPEGYHMMPDGTIMRNDAMEEMGGEEVPEGSHRMPDGTIMRNDEMEAMHEQGSSDMSLDAELSLGLSADTKVFNVRGVDHAFDLKEIRVNKGDTVTINFESTEGYHDWVVDTFDAATAKVQPGTPTSVTFVADEAGTFEYYCSVGNHRAQGMVGTLIVE